MKTYFALFAAFNIDKAAAATAVARRCTAIPHGTLTATIQYEKEDGKEESAETTQSNGTELTENSIRRA